MLRLFVFLPDSSLISNVRARCAQKYMNCPGFRLNGSFKVMLDQRTVFRWRRSALDISVV